MWIFSLFLIINYCYSFSDDTHTMVFALPVQICFRVCVCVCVCGMFVCIYVVRRRMDDEQTSRIA